MPPTNDLAQRPRANRAAYSLAPDVILVPVEDGSARLLDLNGSFFAVSAIGAQMLQGALERPPAEVVERIAARYGAGPSQVEADLSAFLHDLEKQGLLHQGQARPRRGLGVALACLLVLPLIWVVRACFRSPARRAGALLLLARFCCRLFGWSRTVAVWKRAVRPRQAPSSSPEEEQVVQAIDEAVRRVATRAFFAVACKERALCCWALTRWAGAPVDLVVGLSLYPLGGHCWCEHGQRALSDYPDHCAQYRPVVRYS
jgi:hypothetical protein